MKNLSLAVFLTLVSTLSFAGIYSDEVLKQKTCETVGVWSALAFKERTALAKGDTSSFDKILDEFEAKSDTDSSAVKFAKYKRTTALSDGIIYGQTQASDEKDACMHGWANCMDFLH